MSDPGGFDTLVQVERRAPGLDACGEPSSVWVLRPPRWCRRRELDGGEGSEAGAARATRRIELTTQHLIGADHAILPSDRLVLDGLSWNVRSAAPRARGSLLVIVADALAAVPAAATMVLDGGGPAGGGAAVDGGAP
ncbi:MAG: hypothetical protein AAFX81_16000 [Pseudomonadota bacterium]